LTGQSVSSNARLAAPIARRMSSCPPSATWPSTSSVAGLTLLNVAPDAAPTSSPSMSRRVSGSNDPTLVSIIAASSSFPQVSTGPR